jgi:hypothetical protein
VMADGRACLKQGVYCTQRLVHKLVDRYRMPEASGDGPTSK